jgi:monovalent cation/hydrogen antiporter
VGLVLATMAAVACVAHALIPGLPWAAAFVLGAIVSPTDALAGVSIMRHLDAPRRLVSNIAGEGLFNDATAVVAYRVAVAAVLSGSFSLAGAGLKFMLDATGGVAIGIAVGWIVAQIRTRTTDAQVSVTISLLTGYAAYIPADAVGASGILAAVTAGIYMGTTDRGSCPSRAPACKAISSGTSSTSSSTRSCSSSSGCSFARSLTDSRDTRPAPSPATPWR